MVRYKCAVTGCASSSETGGLSFHSFPTADDRRKMWLEALGCGSSGSTLARRVCSLHFDERAFTRVGSETQRGMKRRRLCPDAVPKGSASAAGVGRAITEERTGTDAAMLVCPMEASWTVEHNPSALTNTSDNSIHFVESDFAIGCNAEVGTDTGACGDMSLTHLTAGCKPKESARSDHSYCRMRHFAVQTDGVQATHMVSKGVQVATTPKVRSEGTQTDFQAWSTAGCGDELEDTAEILDSSGHRIRAPLPSSPIRCSTPLPSAKDLDETYEPSFHDSHLPSGCDSVPPSAEKQYIVFESCLMELFSMCTVCQASCKAETTLYGSLLQVETTCACGHKSCWLSQPKVSNRALGGMLLCAAICFSGASPEKVLRLLKQANIQVPSTRTYYSYQGALFQPAIQRVWDTEREAVIESLHGPVALAGDGRCDSPGFSAKFMTYTFMAIQTSKIIHFVQVQLGENSEVKSSNAMEKFGLKKGLGELKDQNVTICSLTTDRHVGIKKYMRTCEPGIEHTYDAWHVGKGVKKKLTVAAKKSACAALKEWIQPVVNHLYWCVAVSEGDGDLLVAMWKSMLNHVINMHAGHDSPYPRCLHGDVQNGKWLTPGTPAYARLVSIATEQGLLKDIRKLSSSGQTYGLESYHSLLIRFAPKSVAFSTMMMRARTQLAALHHNENAGREQAVVARNCALRWKRKMLRAKKGAEVVCPVKSKPTYAYVDKLMTEMLHESSSCSSLKKAQQQRSSTSSSPKPLAMIQLNQPRLSKSELVAARQSRFVACSVQDMP
ncbi:uncharacterized protein LOC119393581 [Rhipicephalus sanguineus]|uniref:uncharacterized protein LOC119393581 n=2 Tax=Rhipicephalus sanguineus TaxID=34632 RepID=UPI0018935C6B|nr:uncharacterized protein LOC119393581 [Rhipicephalus sanguineus]